MLVKHGLYSGFQFKYNFTRKDEAKFLEQDIQHLFVKLKSSFFYQSKIIELFKILKCISKAHWEYQI